MQRSMHTGPMSVPMLVAGAAATLGVLLQRLWFLAVGQHNVVRGVSLAAR